IRPGGAARTDPGPGFVPDRGTAVPPVGAVPARRSESAYPGTTKPRRGMVGKGLRPFSPARLVGLWPLSQDLVDQAEILGLFRRHEAVALHGVLDGLQVLSGVLHVDLVQPVAGLDDFLGVDLDVRRLALE